MYYKNVSCSLTHVLLIKNTKLKRKRQNNSNLIANPCSMSEKKA